MLAGASNKGVNRLITFVTVFVCKKTTTVFSLGIGGLMLYFMSHTCKGYKSTSENKMFGSNIKQKICNDEKS